jgi:hypothetical protein
MINISSKLRLISTITFLLSSHLFCQSQNRYLIGVSSGYGIASWHEHPTQSGLAYNDQSTLTDKSTSGSYFMVGVSAQLILQKLAIGPSYRHYDMSFASSPSTSIPGNEYRFNSLGAKANYLIRLSDKLQLSPGLDAGIFMFSGFRNNITKQKFSVSPSAELRRDLGKAIITAGIEGNFLFFKSTDLWMPPTYVQKSKARISSTNFKIGVIIKL